jgi:hypothetical protein
MTHGKNGPCQQKQTDGYKQGKHSRALDDSIKISTGGQGYSSSSFLLFAGPPAEQMGDQSEHFQGFFFYFSFSMLFFFLPFLLSMFCGRFIFSFDTMTVFVFLAGS